MKRILLFGFLLGMFNLAFSQSIELSYDGSVIEAEHVFTVEDTLNSYMLFHELTIKNVGTDIIRVLAKKTEIELVPETTNYFCYAGQCYGPTTYISPNFIELAPDADTMDFSGDYIPGEHEGTTTIAYTFFDESNEADSIRIFVEYQAYNTGVQDLAGNISLSSIYPNPATDVAQIDYQFKDNFNDASVLVYSLLGALVSETTIEGMSGTMQISTAEMDEGIYFVNVIADHAIIRTEKLIVK